MKKALLIIGSIFAIILIVSMYASIWCDGYEDELFFTALITTLPIGACLGISQTID